MRSSGALLVLCVALALGRLVQASEGDEDEVFRGMLQRCRASCADPTGAAANVGIPERCVAEEGAEGAAAGVAEGWRGVSGGRAQAAGVDVREQL
jgi:hypothetical protein